MWCGMWIAIDNVQVCAHLAHRLLYKCGPGLVVMWTVNMLIHMCNFLSPSHLFLPCATPPLLMIYKPHCTRQGGSPKLLSLCGLPWCWEGSQWGAVTKKVILLLARYYLKYLTLPRWSARVREVKKITLLFGVLKRVKNGLKWLKNTLKFSIFPRKKRDHTGGIWGRDGKRPHFSPFFYWTLT